MIHGDMLEDVQLAFPIEEVGNRDRKLLHTKEFLLRRCMPNLDGAVCIGVRQGLKQRCVHYAENTGIGAYAQSEHQNAAQAESHIFAQHAHGKVQILQQVFSFIELRSLAALNLVNSELICFPLTSSLQTPVRMQLDITI